MSNKTNSQPRWFVEEEFRRYCERQKGYEPCQRIYIDGRCTDYMLPLSDEEYADLALEKGQKVIAYVDMNRAKETWDAIGIPYDRSRFIGVTFAADFYHLKNKDAATIAKSHTIWISPTPVIVGEQGIIRYFNKIDTESRLLESMDFEEVLWALKNNVPLALPV
jgi:hypothetical protein